jgi:hypothetical protein
MKSMRKYIYAALLMLSALSFTPSTASAQDAAGSFTLTNEVHWQSAIVPAGKYRFTIGSTGPAEMLTLRSMGENGTTFMLMVNDMVDSASTEASRIVVVSRAGQRFVSTMQLPEFGMTLRFAVPAEAREVAQAVATTSASATR